MYINKKNLIRPDESRKNRGKVEKKAATTTTADRSRNKHENTYKVKVKKMGILFLCGVGEKKESENCT